jgi:hypothetical protein
MCEPISASTAIMLGVAAASAGAAAYTVHQQTKTQKAIAENNANIAEAAAQDAELRGEKAAQETLQQSRQLASAQRAAFSARGVDISEGTAAEVLGQTDFFGQMDAATARNNGRKEAWNARAQKVGYQIEERAARPGMAAGLSLLSSGSQVASRWYTAGG